MQQGHGSLNAHTPRPQTSGWVALTIELLFFWPPWLSRDSNSARERAPQLESGILRGTGPRNQGQTAQGARLPRRQDGASKHRTGRCPRSRASVRRLEQVRAPHPVSFVEAADVFRVISADATHGTACSRLSATARTMRRSKAEERLRHRPNSRYRRLGHAPPAHPGCHLQSHVARASASGRASPARSRRLIRQCGRPRDASANTPRASPAGHLGDEDTRGGRARCARQTRRTASIAPHCVVPRVPTDAPSTASG